MYIISQDRSLIIIITIIIIIIIIIITGFLFALSTYLLSLIIAIPNFMTSYDYFPQDVETAV